MVRIAWSGEPTGPRGAKGATGDTGPQGATGPQGPQGNPGLDGVNGVANDTATAGYIDNPGSATHASLTAAYAARGWTPTAPDLAAVEVTPGVTLRPIEYFDGHLWAIDGEATLKRSADDGATWTTVRDLPLSGVHRIIPTSDGEIVIASNAGVQKSAGWSANPATANFASKVTRSAPAGVGILAWGVDGDGIKFIVTEYSGADRSESRYVWISTDSGATFNIAFDKTTIDPTNGSHWHGCCYDPWADIFFVSNGHGPSRGVYWSADNGATWAALAGPLQPDGMPTAMAATDDGIALGSDAGEGGLYGIPRTPNPADMRMRRTARWAVTRNGVAGFADRAWRDPRTGLVYFGFKSDWAELAPALAAGNARSGRFVWTEPTPSSTRLSSVVVTETGSAHGYLTRGGSYDGFTALTLSMSEDSFDPSNARGSNATQQTSLALGPGASTPNAGDTVLGVKASTSGAQNGTAVGYLANTGTRAAALGASARANGDDSVAVGYDSEALGFNQVGIGSGVRVATAATRATVIGNNANVTAGSDQVVIGASASAAATDTTVVGRSASATAANGTALGRAAIASGVSSTALGSGAIASETTSVAVGRLANAGHASSVALGAQTTTTAANQVQIGARHLELSESAAIGTPGLNGARLAVRDDGAGKTQLVVVFNTGGLITLATQP